MTITRRDWLKSLAVAPVVGAAVAAITVHPPMDAEEVLMDADIRLSNAKILCPNCRQRHQENNEPQFVGEPEKMQPLTRCWLCHFEYRRDPVELTEWVAAIRTYEAASTRVTA